jgi:hypothetical protein
MSVLEWPENWCIDTPFLVSVCYLLLVIPFEGPMGASTIFFYDVTKEKGIRLESHSFITTYTSDTTFLSIIY